jgi:hypothetical protein
MFTALINLLVDFLFVDILFAPTMDPKLRKNVLKEIPIQSLPPPSEQRPPTTTHPPVPVSLNQPSALSNLKRLTVATMKSSNLNLQTTRVLPGTTKEAHTLARLSVRGILSDRISALQDTILRHDDQRRAITLKSKSRMRSSHSLSVSGFDVEEQFAELSGDIAEQRKLLKRNQQEKFDELWGVDPTGEFSKQRQTYWFFWSRPKSAADLIKKELMFVHQEATKRSEKLQHASSAQTGMEILHYFILDLLGR